MMSQCSMFFWRQFQLPYGEKAPYFEEAPFLLLAMVSACNPVITMYYVLPYRRRVVEMIGFWRRSSAKVQLYDITFAASTSTTDATRELLVAGRNISLFPDDPNIAAMLGYESIFQGTTMVLIVWILFPVFPGYCLSIYYRTKIMHILNDNTSAMSNSTKRAQHDLIKALTIQAVLPVVMMSQCSVYFWRQFQLPFGDKAPYFEEAPFLLLAMVSAFSPAITIYYLLPYRKRVVEIVIFWKKFAQIGHDIAVNWTRYYLIYVCLVAASILTASETHHSAHHLAITNDLVTEGWLKTLITIGDCIALVCHYIRFLLPAFLVAVRCSADFQSPQCTRIAFIVFSCALFFGPNVTNSQLHIPGLEGLIGQHHLLTGMLGYFFVSCFTAFLDKFSPSPSIMPAWLMQFLYIIFSFVMVDLIPYIFFTLMMMWFPQMFLYYWFPIIFAMDIVILGVIVKFSEDFYGAITQKFENFL
ncbi:unnamed protein product, partial [Mesorhabditis spiculigera]